MAQVSKPRRGDEDDSWDWPRDSIDVESNRSPVAPSHTSPRASFNTANAPVPEDDAYPEGGFKAWLVVFGAFCGTAASIGVYNTAGLFEAYMSSDLLPNTSSSTIGWIFGLYAFVTWFAGLQVGPTFDAIGPTKLMLGGSLCTLAGIFALSFCTKYYQIILAYSILVGAGASLLMNPAVSSVAHWFNVRRGYASGIAWLGSGIGGVIFPLMLQSLLPKIGWSWSLRVFGLLLFFLCAISVVFCQRRLGPRHGANTTWRDTIPDPKIFMDRTGAMALTTAGMMLTDMAYFIPMTYIPSYYIRRQGLPPDSALAGSASFAYQLLAISNGSSCFGRLVAGWVSDQLGRYNTMTISLFLCAVSVLGFWLPDTLIPDLKSEKLLITFVVLFGCVSGSNVSLLPVCIGQLCETQDFGRYYASGFTFVAFGALISIPVAGALLDAVDAPGKEKYWTMAVFTGICYVGATLCFLIVRIRVKGFDLRIKW